MEVLSMIFSFLIKLTTFGILMIILALVILYFFQNKMLYVPGIKKQNYYLNLFLVIPPLSKSPIYNEVGYQNPGD